MKTILFVEGRYKSYYGAQKSMVKLINSLKDSEFRKIALTTKEDKLSNELTKRGIEVDIKEPGKYTNVFGGEILSYSFLKKFYVLRDLIIFNFKMLRYMAKKNVDIIYINDLRGFVYVFLAGKLLRKKLVWYIRADFEDTLLARAALKWCDSVITIANGVLENIPQKVIDKHSGKIKNIYTGFDFDKFRIYDKPYAKEALGLDTEETVLGIVGSINKRKNLELLAQSVKKAAEKNDNLRILIVGDVSDGSEQYWKDIESYLNNNKINYTYLGYHSDISMVYSAIDVLVLPSNSEGLPRVLIEGMAHKLPVIATEVAGTPEIITHGKTGFLISKNAVDELTFYIEELAEKKEIRDYIGNNGNESVRRKFNDALFEKNINRHFNELANN